MTTTIIQPSNADTQIMAYSPNSNNGAGQDMGVGFATPNELARSLIKFDLSLIPANQIIDSVTLSLYTSATYVALPPIKLYRLLRDWVETQATWNIYASGASWQIAGASGTNDIYDTEIGYISGSSLHPSAGQENLISLSATEFQKIYDGTYSNYGFLLKSTLESNAAKIFFRTREYSGTSYRPKLTIVSHEYDPVPFEPYDQYTQSLLHFDGTNNSYYFRDEIQNNWTPYRYPSTSGSGAIIKTDQYKFGTASGYFTGSAVGDWIQTGTQFDLVTTDWTMEAQIRPNFDGISTFWYKRSLFGYDLDDYNFWGCYINGSAVDNQKLVYEELFSGSTVIRVFSSIIPLIENAWQHVAFVRQGTSIKGYLDGVLCLSGSCSSSIATFSGQTFRIGNYGNASMYRGYMDEFRLSDTARWTTDFTPPDAPYAPESQSTTQTFYRQPFMYSGYPWM